MRSANFNMSSEMQFKEPAITFRYQPSPKIMLLCGLFFCACAAGLGYQACTNTRGLILNGIIEFTASEASILYWILTVFSVLFVLAAALIMTSTLIYGVPDVVLTDDSISFPVGFLKKRPYSLPYSQITGLSQSETNGQRFLVLRTATKTHHIILNWLGSKDAEFTLLQELNKRLTD